MAGSRAQPVRSLAGAVDVVGRLWFAVVGLLAAAALAIQLALIITGGQDANSGSTGATGSTGSTEEVGVRLLHLFSYFTIQSNIFVILTSFALALSIRRDGPVWRVVHLDALLGIIITAAVYETMLASLVHVDGWSSLVAITFHYVVPATMVTGWLVFGPRPRLTWRATAAAFVWPLLWLVYTFVHGAISGWYPYPFLDAATIGFAAAFRNALIVMAAGSVLAVLITLLDRHLPSLARARTADG